MDDGVVALGRAMEQPASLVAQCCGWLAAHASLFGSLAGLLPTDLRETVLRCLADRGLLDDHTFGLLFGPEAGFGRLSLVDCAGVSDAGLCRFLDECHDSLTELTISRCPRVSGVSLRRVGHLCTDLHSLRINDPSSLIGEDDVAGLFLSSREDNAERWCKLQTLSLTGWGERLQDTSLSQVVQSLSNLRSLHLTNCPALSDAFVFASAPALSSLTTLELSGCHFLSDLSMRAITKHLTSLETLKLDQNSCLTQKALSYIATSELGARLTRLELNATTLGTIPPEIGLMTALTHLSACSSDISRLPPEIGRLSNLSALVLFCNPLTDLPDELCALGKLKTLHLGENQITRLPDDIGDLSSLEGLCLDDNSLALLPSSMGKLTQLRTLSLDSTHVRELPQSFWDLTQLQTLVWSRVNLNTLPEEIGHLTELTSLDLEHNQLAHLPDGLYRGLTNLKRLALSNNDLFEISPVTLQPSPEIGRMCNLTFLPLDNNRLQRLPAAIMDLPKLKALSLASNLGLGTGLADLRTQASESEAQLDHRQHGRLPDLCVLSLEHTELSELPPLVWQATSLTALSLEYNRLATLPAEMAQLRRIKTLNVGSNVLGVFPTAVLGLTQLIELCADCNGLTELPDEFACLSALRFLSLQANSFSVVPRPLLGMTALERVDLSDNRIASIDDDVQEALLRMPRVLRVNVRDNPVADQPLPAALQGILHEEW